MGRRNLACGASRNIQPIFEIKFRKPGDRLNSNGNKIEGGQIFSRHFPANHYEHAKVRANGYAKKNGVKVISISKVHPEDVIGNHKDWGLERLLGIPMPERKRDAIVENKTLDDILFNK